MVRKSEEQKLAVALRKQGLSYLEILNRIPVAKSTLSLWLREIGLSQRQQQRLTQKKLDSARRGGERRRTQRLQVVEAIWKSALQDIKTISNRELWLMGVMLYWAEGSKEKEGRPGSGVQFTNSDPYMIKLFLKWLKDIARVPDQDIKFDIFIHENSKNHIRKVVHHWSRVSTFPARYFSRIYFKRNNKTNRKNVGESYFGVLRVGVKASSSINRKITGWINGINQYYWGVV